MTLDRWLAVIGVLFGLPGFLTFFLTTQQIIGILVAIIGLILLVAAVVVHKLTNLPPFTVKSARVTLEFNNAEGKVATLMKEYRIRANYNHLQLMIHRNIAADGRIENICWNDQPVPLEHIRRELGEYVVSIHFPRAPTRWREFPGKLSYTVLDSFEGNPESLHYVVDFPTKVANFRIVFPASRNCFNARAYKMEGAGERPIGTPTITSGGRSIEMELKKPRTGSEYCIDWDW